MTSPFPAVPSRSQTFPDAGVGFSPLGENHLNAAVTIGRVVFFFFFVSDVQPKLTLHAKITPGTVCNEARN